MVSLNLCPVGKVQEIKYLTGNSSKVEGLRSAGIEEGAFVTVLNSFHGSVIIAMNNLRYALGKDEAECIKV